MSQYPPTTMPPPGYVNPGMVPQRTSAAAVASLIFGILGCLIITGIIAIITGIIGISATKNPNVKGRGMAIAGLILGLIGTLSGGLCLGLGGAVYLAARPAIQTVAGFTSAASSGDFNKAMEFVDETQVPKDKLVAIVDDLKSLGEFKEYKPGAKNNVDFTAGVYDFQGTLVFQNGQTRSIDVSLRKQSDGKLKITALDVTK
jgi:hypothetical protein